MLSRLKAACAREGIDLTKMSLTMDAWCVAQSLRARLHHGGFPKIIMAGKSHDTWTMHGKKQDAAPWKKDLVLPHPTWGIAGPSCRVHGHRPPCGSMGLFLFQKSTTRSSSVRNLSQVVMRGAEIWHLWTQQHLIECVWKILQSIVHMRSMPWQGNGLYTAWLIKVFASVLAIRLQAHRPFSTWSMTQIMRKLRRDHHLKDLLTTHFQGAFLTT